MRMSNSFFVVRDPALDSTPGEILMEFTASGLARYIIGCGLESFEKERHTIHVSREAAVADVDSRVAKAFTKLQALRTGSGSGPSTISLWAALRGKVSLSEIVDMVRQDLEASPGNTDEAQSMADRLARLLDKADGE
jgi:hypothetical protein